MFQLWCLDISTLGLLTCDMWYMTHRGWWTLCKNFRSQALTVWKLWWFEDISTKDELINQLIDWSFVELSSEHHNSQTVWPRDLKFLHNVHHPICVMCHVSHVTCHMSCVTCHVSCVTKQSKKLKNGGASRSRVCYQRGLPRLVSLFFDMRHVTRDT